MFSQKRIASVLLLVVGVGFFVLLHYHDNFVLVERFNHVPGEYHVSNDPTTTLSSSDECVPEIVNSSFFVTSTKPSRSNFDFGKYKYLLIDAHKGPQMDTLASLSIDFGIPKSQIATQCGVNYCRHMEDIRRRFSSLPVGEERSFRESFVKKSYRHRNIEPLTPELKDMLGQYDVFICSFPSWHCKALLNMGKVVVLRFSHSPWHMLLKGTVDLGWITTMKKTMHGNPLHVITSNNPYHYTMYKHVIGKFPVPWPATYIHIRGISLNETYSPFKNDTLVMEIGAGYSTLTLDVFNEANAISVRESLWSFKSFHDMVRPTDRRTSVSLCLVFPYAMHTAKITEMYALGVPIMMPSLNLIEKLSAKHEGILPHRDGIPTKFKDPATGGRQGYCGKDMIVKTGDSKGAESTRYWSRFSEFYLWPHVYYYDSLEPQGIVDSVEKIMKNPADRISRSKGMLSFFDKIESRRIVKKHLETALKAYDATRK